MQASGSQYPGRGSRNYWWGGGLQRAPPAVAVAHMQYFKKKVNKLVDSVKNNESDTLKLLKESFKKWGEKAKARPKFELQEASLTEVMEILKGLKGNKSYSHDKINSMAIKIAVAALSRPLQHIINLSIQNQYLLQQMEAGEAHPTSQGQWSELY